MKVLFVLSVALACAAADVVSDESLAPIIRYESDSNPDGSYRYAYETANGIYAEAQGALKNVNNEYAALEVDGGYKYNSPDGTPVELTYKANEFGFQPVGSHLPVPPPTPEAILRSLAYNAAQSAQVNPTQRVASNFVGSSPTPAYEQVSARVASDLVAPSPSPYDVPNSVIDILG